MYSIAGSEDWGRRVDNLGLDCRRMGSYQAANDIIPKMLETQMNDALEALTGAINERNPSDVQQAHSTPLPPASTCNCVTGLL